MPTNQTGGTDVVSSTNTLMPVEEGTVIPWDAEIASSTPTFAKATAFLMSALNGKSVEILLVEDNPADVRLTREIFEHDGDPTHLNVVGDGELAMAYLRRQEPYSDVPRPQLVLLDLNLPKKDGREVLEEMKADANLCKIPVVVLTTSAAESDISRSYELHANCYITKPLDLDEYFDVVGSIKNFWLANARLPSP
jgi:two-component system, chemotaxis family, response regulator Rcp1